MWRDNNFSWSWVFYRVRVSQLALFSSKERMEESSISFKMKEDKRRKGQAKIDS